MRKIKRFFIAYSADFWVFAALIVALTVFLYFICVAASAPTNPDPGKIGSFVILLGVSSLVFILLMQDNQTLQICPLAWFSRRAGRRFEDDLSDLHSYNHQSNILMLAALLVVFVVNLLSRILAGQPIYVLAIEVMILGITLYALLLTIRKGISVRQLYLVIGIALVLPIVMTLLTDASAERMPSSYIWLVAAMVFSKFLSNRKVSQFFFKLAVCMMLVGVILEVLFIPGMDVVATIQFILVVLSVGFVIFSSLDFYISNATENMAGLERINRELKETQAQLMRREQMVTLGQLIAGVSHEINTPIGAIKASSELMASFDLGRVIKEASRYSAEDLEVLTDVLELSARSLKNMRSTIDLRRGKSQMLEYLNSMGLPKAHEINQILAIFEICDIEKVADNLDIFRRDNIVDILRTARKLAPMLGSIQNIRFSAEKVTKIVFALKTFSHMNATGGKSEFDIVKNIDNVLVLYLNQLKRGIEVIRQYDERLPHVYGNVEEIGQVWTNIVQNAIYAMSYVGKLTIRIRNLGRMVEVAFTDTGVGIPPENLERVFEPFFTTKPLGEGSGIGMDISRKVIEKHGGEIRIASTVGQGTTITVLLPTAAHADTEEVA